MYIKKLSSSCHRISTKQFIFVDLILSILTEWSKTIAYIAMARCVIIFITILYTRGADLINQHYL